MHRKRRRDHRRQIKSKLEPEHFRSVTGPPPGYDAIAADQASENDREWFAAHPGANWRLRRTVAGELGLPVSRWTVVFQFEPGQRMRVPMDGSLSDEQVQIMAEVGDFVLRCGLPVWIPRDEGIPS